MKGGKAERGMVLLFFFFLENACGSPDGRSD